MGQQNSSRSEKACCLRTLNQADLCPVKFSGKTGPLSWLWRWVILQVEISIWVLLSVGTHSAKTQVLVDESPVSTTIWPQQSSPIDSLVISWGKIWVDLLRSNPQHWSSWMSTLGSLFPNEDAVSSWGLSQCSAVIAKTESIQRNLTCLGCKFD